MIAGFIGRDPIAADINLYRYCGTLAAILVDPSGLIEGNLSVYSSISSWDYVWAWNLGSTYYYGLLGPQTMNWGLPGTKGSWHTDWGFTIHAQGTPETHREASGLEVTRFTPGSDRATMEAGPGTKLTPIAIGGGPKVYWKARVPVPVGPGFSELDATPSKSKCVEVDVWTYQFDLSQLDSSAKAVEGLVDLGGDVASP